MKNATIDTFKDTIRDLPEGEQEDKILIDRGRVMKKYKVRIIETIELNHVIEIEIPDSNDIETFLEDLTTREDMDRLRDVIREVNGTSGCKIVNVIEDKNPTGEIEIGDHFKAISLFKL